MDRIILALLLIMPSTSLYAQHERYELGLRLRQFEREWNDTKDLAGQKRALAIVKDATNQFFSLKFGEAGKTLDSAKWALTHVTPRTEDQLWVASLMMKPEKRLVDLSEKAMKVTLTHFYKVKGVATAGATAKLRFRDGEFVKVPLTKLPVSVEVPFPIGGAIGEGETDLQLHGELNDQPVLFSSINVSRIQKVDDRIKSLKVSLASGTLKPSVAATLKDRLDFLTELKDGIPPETDFPVQSMLDHADRLAKANAYRDASNDSPGLGRIQSYWFTVPLEKKQLAPIRLGVPAGLSKDKAVPVVVSLHGAGGSENMFFDSYGAGQVVRECEKRGWLLLAPRSPGFTSSPPVKDIIEQLKTVRAMDTSKIFILGHSMGAGQTVDLCQKHPGYFAGAAVMGGGGRIRDAKAFDDLPTFIGIGDQDFALTGAKSLHQTLQKSGAKRLTFKEYPNVEHLVIVREALPDVFRMFDDIVKSK